MLRSTCIVALTLCACALLLSVRATVVSVPLQLDGYARSLLAEVHGTRTDAARELEQVRLTVDSRLESIQAESLEEIGAWRQSADARLGDAISRADARLMATTATVSGIREDLKPVLANSATLTANANASWDDLYWDVKASVESVAVTNRAVAEAAEAVAEAAPKTTAASAELTQQAAGIATDVHTFTQNFVAPKPWYKRLWAAGAAVLDIVF